MPARRSSTTSRRSPASRRSSSSASSATRARRRGGAGHRRLLALRQRQQARELRASARDDSARADLRARPRRRRRARPEGDHPRRLVRPGLHARPDRRPARLRRRAGRRLVPRLGGDHRRRRTRLHGAARPAGGEVLHARVLRQVHALPRGDALARPAARADRGRRRDAVRPRPRARRLRPDPRQVALRARRLRRLLRGELRGQVLRRVQAPRGRGRLPFGGASSIDGVLAPSDTHVHKHLPLVPHELRRAGHAGRGRRGGAGAEGPGPGRDRGAAGIEIPVFCYEPRIGPPIGACRMCLVEVEGQGSSRPAAR